MSTTRRLATHPLAAAAVAGVALWVTRASFDVAGASDAPVRVAMLPSAAELLGLLVMSLLIAAGMASLLHVRGSSRPYWEPVGDALMPAFALGLLILPYLPFLADWLPALRLLAGPGRLLVWVVVIGQVLWIFLPQLRSRVGAGFSVMGSTRAAVVFACVAVFLSTPFLSNARALSDVFSGFVEAVRQLPSARPGNAVTAALGSVFDQEFGILPFAPIFLVGFVGLGAMLRDPRNRPVAAALVVAALVLVAVPGAIDPWWRRSLTPGRTVVFLLPLLVVPIAWMYERVPRPSWARSAAQVLLLVSLGITFIVWSFPDEVPVQQDGDGASSLLRWLSPTWQLWSEAPTYVTASPLAASVRVGLWAAGLSIVAWLWSRRGVRSEGRTALLVTTGVTAVAVLVPSLTAALMSDPRTRFDAEARGLLPLIETFDPVARPVAVRYDPFSLVPPGDLPPLFALSAVPGQRTGRQPLRVVLNARFRLPAGSYELDLKGSELAGTVPDAAVFLQIGREGGALISWPLTMTPGGHAQYRFDVPVDAEFVAFRAAPSIEPTIAAMRITPVSVVEVRKRLSTPSVLSAGSFDHVMAFFHGGAYPERDGFWVQGRASTRVTLLKKNPNDTAVALAIHSGAKDNDVTLSTPEWSQPLKLVQGVTQRVFVPTQAGDRFIPLTISASGGFVPAEIGASRDRRLLGAWIAFIPDAVPTALQ
jgi:hypothetical protein